VAGAGKLRPPEDGPQMKIALKELAKLLDGKVIGDGKVEITGVAGIKEARPGDITFLANPRYEAWLRTSRASAVIMEHNNGGVDMPVVESDNPYYAFLKAVKVFHGSRFEIPEGVHPTCVVGKNVKMGAGVRLGPNVVIDDDVEIGDGTAVMAGAYVGAKAVLGEEVLIYPNVTIREETRLGNRVIIHSGTVIGSDGFGYAKNGDEYHKIPHVGNVVIEEDVEIGANCCVDRATTGTTLIKKGVKLDNLVHIAHNVVINENSIALAQVGIAGSTEIGRNVILAGQAGLVAHIKIGDNARIGSQAGVTKSVPADTSVSGYPAADHAHAKRLHASLQRLPDLIKRFREMENRIEELEKERAK
jgi:UDP-3-O-[3-hydroxymyristoyl] glucosamine N-acyltransferase